MSRTHPHDDARKPARNLALGGSADTRQRGLAGLFQGCDWNALARACGYRNLDKGRRRLQALAAGDLRLYETLRGGLVTGLGLPLARLDTLVQAELDHRQRAADADFVPHIVWLTEHRVPTSITQAGLIGACRMRILLPENGQPLSMLRQAIQACPDHVPFFGRVLGFRLNYRPDASAEFNRHGDFLRRHDRAIPAGTSTGDHVRLGALLMP